MKDMPESLISPWTLCSLKVMEIHISVQIKMHVNEKFICKNPLQLKISSSKSLGVYPHEAMKECQAMS